MVHIGDTDEPLAEIVARLRPGDVVTHALTGRKHGILVADRLDPGIPEAQARGVVFDAARGGNHLSFRTLEIAAEAGFLPDTLSTDMNVRTTGLPGFGQVTLGTYLLSVGVPLADVVARMTVRPAAVVGLDQGFAPGSLGDVTVLRVIDGASEISDVDGRRRTVSQRLEAWATVRAGQFQRTGTARGACRHPAASSPATRRSCTGSSRGIGFAIAGAMLDAGARVALNGRDPAVLAAAAEELGPRGESIAVAADVGFPDEVERLLATAQDAFGLVDILVNNAALANPSGHILDVTPERWDEIVRSNLTSVFLCTRSVADALVEAGVRGAIVNISSFAAHRAHRDLAAYDATKGGVEAFTRSSALDLSPYGSGSTRSPLGPSGPGRAATTRRASSAARRRSLWDGSGSLRRSPVLSSSSPRMARRTSPASASSSMAG